LIERQFNVVERAISPNADEHVPVFRAALDQPETIMSPSKLGRDYMRTAEPLVSILIPAFNAEKWISEAIRSALAQTWVRKEVIVVDDGSTDRTAKIAESFGREGVRVVRKPNEGAAATRNKAFSLSRGEYIQWLDADDLLAPDKIAHQLGATGPRDQRVLLSSAWGTFAYRPNRAKFIPTGLWRDQPPSEWLIQKLSGNYYMQTATWLTHRELAENAGPWDTRLLGDDDGEYFCRVLLASEGVKFVRDSKVYYRNIPSVSLSHIGTSDRKMEAMLVSMKLHIQYLRSLDDTERARNACLTYLSNWSNSFYPYRPDIIRELRGIAHELGGTLTIPPRGWKYERRLRSLLGPHNAKRVQFGLSSTKARLVCALDKGLSMISGRGIA
jgi:glycosyltransferase involved in cell wall biosynthesis